MELKGQIDAAEKNLERLLEWVGRFDQKAMVVLGIDTGMFGVIATFAPPLNHLDCVTVIVSLITVLSLACSLCFIYIGSYPQTNGPSDSLLFFGSIAKKDLPQFKNDFLKRDSAEYLKDLLEQCYRNSEIINYKFWSLKWSYKILLLTILPWIITIYMFKSSR